MLFYWSKTGPPSFPWRFSFLFGQLWFAEEAASHSNTSAAVTHRHRCWCRQSSSSPTHKPQTIQGNSASSTHGCTCHSSWDGEIQASQPLSDVLGRRFCKQHILTLSIFLLSRTTFCLQSYEQFTAKLVIYKWYLCKICFSITI